MHVNTSVDLNGNVIYAVNPYNPEFADRVAFLQTDDPVNSLTCDRTEFIGRNGTLKNPAAMSRSRLSGKNGAALDPCSAIQVSFEIAARPGTPVNIQAWLRPGYGGCKQSYASFSWIRLCICCIGSSLAILEPYSGCSADRNTGPVNECPG